MPSPALQKLDVLPITPLTSQPNSPESSRPSSRRSSHSINIQAGPSSSSSQQQSPSRKSSLSQAIRASYFTAPDTNASLSALTTIRSLDNASNAATASAGRDRAGDGSSVSASSSVAGGDKDADTESAVKQKDMVKSGSEVLHKRPKQDSAIDSADEEEDDADGPTGRLRTGNEKFRRDPTGEGITAHWTPINSNTGSVQTKSPTSYNAPLDSKAAVDGQSAPVHAPALAEALDKHTTNAAPRTVVEPGLKLTPIEQAKKLAAYRAVDMHIKPHHKVIGIGSGSTVPYVIDRILELGLEGNKDRWFVPTGFQSKELIVNAGLKLGDVDQFPSIDVTIDGADDVDIALNAVKGGGACHLREKVLAEAADEFVIIADYRKNNQVLGDSWKQGIPIEVPPFAYSKVLANLKRIPGCLNPTLRMGKAKAGPVVTDNGNFVIDAPFDEAHMREPEALLMKIKMLTGVVEVGLFCRMALAAYFGNEDGSVTVRWSDGQAETFANQEDQPTITKDKIDFSKNVTDELLTLQGYLQGGQEATPASLKQKLEQLRLSGITDEGGEEE